MNQIQSICVYCGSNTGKTAQFSDIATTLGKDIAKQNLKLIYGGGSIGLMGIVACAVLDHGGHVTGIIPKFLEAREIMLKRVSELIVTEDMHERKMLMFEKADAFVALPGGIGTLEEVIEMMTWAQLGQHKKPILLANINHFWDPLLDLFEKMRSEAFIRQQFEFEFLIEDDINQVIPRLLACDASVDSKSTTDSDVNATISRM